jgi:heme/copper-type cytochrome/quinol oxidase subunit 3
MVFLQTRLGRKTISFIRQLNCKTKFVKMDKSDEITKPIARLYQSDQVSFWYYVGIACVLLVLCFAVYIYLTNLPPAAGTMTKPMSTSTPITSLLFSSGHTVPASSS